MLCADRFAWWVPLTTDKSVRPVRWGSHLRRDRLFALLSRVTNREGEERCYARRGTLLATSPLEMADGSGMSRVFGYMLVPLLLKITNVDLAKPAAASIS